MKITTKQIKKIIVKSLKEVRLPDPPLPLPPYFDKGGTMIGKIRLVTTDVTPDKAKDIWKIAMDALKILKAHKSHWNFTESYIQKIEISKSKNTGMMVETRVFYINENYANTDPVWLASAIFHDSIHVWQYMTGEGVYPNKGEPGAWLDPNGRMSIPPPIVRRNWGNFSKFDFESYCNDKQLGFLRMVGASNWVRHLERIIQKGSHYDNYVANPYE